MRSFVQLREMMASNVELARKLKQMEKKYDEQFQIVFEAIKKLLETDEKPGKKIGFTVKEKQKGYGKRAKKSKKYGESALEEPRADLAR